MSAGAPDHATPARRRRPVARRAASLCVALTLVAALGVLAAAAVRQGRSPADTRLIAAPTPPAVANLAGAAVAGAGAARGALRPPTQRGGLPAAPAAGNQPGSIPPGSLAPGAAAGPTDPRLLAPAPAGAPPRPTPTPQLVESLACRKGVYFDVEPASALVTVNGEPVGEAGQWDEKDEPLKLERPGAYYLRISCPGCRPRWFKVTVDAQAEDKVVKLATRLRD